MRCSTCGEPPVVQWAKTMASAEVDAHVEQLRAQLVASAEDRRLTLRVQIAALQTAHDNPPPGLSPDDTRAFQARATAQVEVIRGEHNAVPTAFGLEHHREGSRRSLYACETHAHTVQADGGPELDVEWYAVLHQTTCDGTQECGCS